MKIGIFAGTFDPVHYGHIEFAKSAIKAGHLERAIIVAEKEPYRKKPHASWDHRQAMIERATEQLLQVDHDYHFASQLAHQHTMKNMLDVARAHYGEHDEFWFLVGSDLFEHMHQWHDLSGDSEYGGFVVALRDDHTMQWLDEKITTLKKIGLQLNIVVISNSKPHVSSGKIREAIKNHVPTDQLPRNVRDYIDTHELY